MSDDLPSEVVFEILKRLPVKSLLRFRCVCKTWLSLITSPDFITNHLNQITSDSTTTTTTQTHTLVRHYSKSDCQEIYSLHSDDNQAFDDIRAGIEFPFVKQAKFYFRVVGSCNGLLCLSDDLFGSENDIILWNPSIRRALTLPKPRFTYHSLGSYMFALGFGFDPNTNDHKVVRMAYVQGDKEYIVPPLVEVFTVSAGNWRRIMTDVPYCIPDHFWTQAFISGVVHWVVYHLSKDTAGVRTFRSLILSFDMGSEELGELNVPRSLARASPLNMSAAVFGGSLTIIHYDRRIWTDSCSIWLMKEYGNGESWINQFNIDLEGGLGMALGLRRNGEILLSKRSGELVSYNCSTRTSVNIGKCGTKDSFYVDSYMDSLILLTKGKKVSRWEASDEEWEDEEPDMAVESNERWIQSVLVQYLSALLREH